jgi:mRNA interferase MazF
VRAAFVPDAGDFVWLTFDPQAGREQAGRRPALVLSPRAYNAKSGLALVCPITNQVKGYPFEVGVAAGEGATGVILADHVKSVDWKARRAEKLGHCTPEVIEEVRAKLAPLIGP